jgi:hypothetical protein
MVPSVGARVMAGRRSGRRGGLLSGVWVAVLALLVPDLTRRDAAVTRWDAALTRWGPTRSVGMRCGNPLQARDAEHREDNQNF